VCVIYHYFLFALSRVLQLWLRGDCDTFRLVDSLGNWVPEYATSV